jgi:hypothetical protein
LHRLLTRKSSYFAIYSICDNKKNWLASGKVGSGQSKRMWSVFAQGRLWPAKDDLTEVSGQEQCF